MISLEERLQRNEIIQATGRISDPFEQHDVTTKYVITVLDLVEKIGGAAAVEQIIDTIIGQHLERPMDRKDLWDYIRNEHNWINAFLSILIFEYAKEYTGIEDIYRFTGRLAISNPNFGIIALGRGMGIGRVYSLVSRLNPNLNHVVNLEVSRISRGQAIIKKTTRPDYRERLQERYGGGNLFLEVMRNDDLLSQGALSAVPVAVIGKREKDMYATMQPESSCEIEGDEFCLYDFRWKPDIEIRRSSLWTMIKGSIYAVGEAIFYKSPYGRRDLDRLTQAEIMNQKYQEDLGRSLQALAEANKELQQALEDLRLTQAKQLAAERNARIYQIRAAQSDTIATLLHQISNFVMSPIQGYFAEVYDFMYVAEKYITALQKGEGVKESLQKFMESLAKLTGYYDQAESKLELYNQLFRSFYDIYESSDSRRNVNADLQGTINLVRNGYVVTGVNIIESLGTHVALNSPTAVLEAGVQALYIELIHNAAKNGAHNVYICSEYIEEEELIRLHFYDDGMGIAAEARERVFDGRGSTTSSSGIGLANAKYIIVDINGGQIRVEDIDEAVIKSALESRFAAAELPEFKTHFVIDLPYKKILEQVNCKW